jgi:DeoR/GlpR family transcriptional regulator of sugar metabolism
MKLKKVAFDVSTKTVLLVDSSKFYSKSLYKILNINDLDVVISDFDSRDLGDFDLKSTEFITIKCKKKED